MREPFRISGVLANERRLTGLRARRGELRGQLRHATDERAAIRQRLKQEPDADAQRLLKQQADHATGNVWSLGEAITTTERQIAAAPL